MSYQNRYDKDGQVILPDREYTMLKQLHTMTVSQKQAVKAIHDAMEASSPVNQWIDTNNISNGSVIQVNPSKTTQCLRDEFPNIFYPYEFSLQLKEQRQWHYIKLIFGLGILATILYFNN